jgi:translation initiation factor IF-2
LARKLRVYEIAKELGLSNKEALDLCLALGVDVKNHSSSIEEAHVDRIRRRAQRDHLGIYAEAAQAAPAEPAPAPPQGEEPLPPVAEPLAPPAPVAEGRRLDLAAVIAEEAAKREEAEQAAIENAAQAPARRQTPLSPSGKPIPPPPGGRPLSPSGKPIPPPPRPQPARDGRSRPAREGGGRPTGGGAGRTGAPRPPLGGGARPGGSGFRPPARTGGAGAPAPRFGGGFGAGRPGGGRSRGVRPNKSRRRISRKEFEELEPTMATTYVPSNEPVPEHEVIVERGSTAQEVAPKLNRSPGDMVRFLLMQGEMVTATQSLSDEMIELYAAELGAKVRLVDPGQEQEAELAAKYLENDDTLDPAAEVPRPPVVTVMGHVDHGKTLLLDRIRHTNVVAGEAGGITQHIGAYQVDLPGGRITFIDTPGHEAFTAMRARGARVTDIVILVVAADDGVMPQTVEAINHAKAAGVPIIVAINKIDRPDANPERVMQQLAEQGLVPEAWGGDTITVQISALQNLGIEELLEQVLVLAEVLELRANPTGQARGVVLEGHLDVGRGPVATVLVQAGTLRVGDPVVAGQAWGKAKALISDRGDKVAEAGPSTPVQVLGFSEVPNAGDTLRVTAEISHAREIAEAREQRLRLAANANRAVGAQGVRLEDIFEQIQQGEVPTLNLIVKADVQGSLEALSDALAKLSRDEVRLEIIHRAVGGITENDVTLAAASHALVIGFNVRPDRRAREAAEARHVEIRTYEIIYQVIEDIEAAVVGMLKPEFEEAVVGEAEVREVFRIPRVGAVAGCYVRSGTLTRGGRVRFLRDGVVLWKGTIASLRRFKEDVREVQAGFECGVGLSDFQDLHAGDIIEAYELREIPRA